MEPPHSTNTSIVDHGATTYGGVLRQGGNKEFNECDFKIPIAVIHHLPFKNTPVKRQKKAQMVTDTGKLLDRMEVFVRI